MLFAAGVGPYAIAPVDVLKAIFGRIIGHSSADVVDTILFNIRLPRIATAAIVGGGLAVAGASFQTLFRNPLVSSDILGVSMGASLGAVIGILFSLSIATIQALSFLGGLAAVGIVIALAAALRGQNEILILVLAGIVVGTLASAIISLVKILADPYQQLPTITFWLLGSLAGVKSSDLAAVLLPFLIGLLPIFLLRWRIGILSLGDDEARTIGVEASRLRLIVIVAATLMTASVVAISGVIGWVGLIVPHMGRLLVGPRFDRLLPASMLLGSAFVVTVDTLARTIARVEVPLGILTAVIGAPVFVFLLARGHRPWAD
jgi:iron complex transport system permease protein